MTQQHPYTVMTVCTGNICRSPMAEIILRAEFESRGIGEDRVRVLSSGVSDEEYGHPIDPRAVRVLRADGYEIPTHHFAHRVTREEIEETDLFLPMTASHMRALLRQLPSSKRAEVHMYRSFDPNLPKPAAGRMPSSDLPFHPIDDVRRDLLNLADGHLELAGPAIPGIHQVDGILAAGRRSAAARDEMR